MPVALRNKTLGILWVLMALVLSSAGAYIGSMKFVTMTKQEAIPEEDTIHIVQMVDALSDEDDMLLRLGMSEAGTESVECIAWVMRTALNRVESSQFPNDLDSVIHQTNQFAVVLYGTYYTAVPNEKCYEALRMIHSGWDGTSGALFFEDLEEADNWFSQNLTFLCKVDHMRFYK